jgi:CO dehydrogenase maturation factor
MKIAVSGKGGVGKTLIAGGLACSFVDRGFKTIAIDADPSPNLALTLGLTAEMARKILPISDNKKLIESKTDTGYSGVYRLSFKVDDVVREYSVSTPFGVNLIVMGTVRSMGSGCTCPENAVVRALLRHLVVERDEAVVLDTEAGVEHMGRATAKHVDTMLIIADPNMKSLEIAKHIKELASGSSINKVYLVGNKVAGKAQEETIRNFAQENSLEILTSIPFDQTVADMEMKGETPLKNRNSEAVRAIDGLASMLISKND